ncbi:protein NLRC3-like [Melanotaenia boesemani]|uniref:protein NLRC3-like n=1 Tax=Melanotaenia boesemani TaxID=1250792 RepID=UPI001C03E11A|nr:protein NLRC3-like [Melanotaenia boesemani]
MDEEISKFSDRFILGMGGGDSALRMFDVNFKETRSRTNKTKETDGLSGRGNRPANIEGREIMERIKQRLKTHLQEKFTWISTSRSTAGTSSNQDFFFQKPPEQNKPIQRVMTTGIAGIGKTFAVQNFALNWAEGKLNQHIDFIFVLPFRELNMLKEGEYSLLQLLLHFYPELKPLQNAQRLTNKQVLFIFDGLDESRFPLDFDGSPSLSDVNQRSTVAVLLINLIKGNLLPKSLLWVTSRPAAANQIPSCYIDQRTEVQGFTDVEKENYFRKRFSSAGQLKEVLSHLRGMISFHFMGHIPIFCWIIAEVFRKSWNDERSRRITTMTELYIYYLLIQTQRTKQKYETESAKKKSTSQNAAMFFNLSKLAFEQLQKGNIIFYEEDLRECSIDVDEASAFCGLCSEVLKQEHGLYQKMMFSFVHLSFQEFLAALYMFHCCETKNVIPLKSFLDVDPADLSMSQLHKKIVDKALQSEKGQLDLFLCFFLGLLQESNNTMLQGLLPPTGSSSDTAEEMKMYLRGFHAGNIPKERCMNLFLCKFELKEKRFQDDIRKFLNSGARLSPIDCSVLSTMLQISGEVMEQLDLTKCYTPLFGGERLILQIRNCKKAELKSDHDSYLDILLSALQSEDSYLRELSLVSVPSVGYRLPHDLFDVLQFPNCKLETLRLCGFTLDFVQCHKLSSILESKHSHLTALDLTHCIYAYQKDYSGYFSKEVEKNEKYDDFIDELSPLTVISSGLIGPICKLKEFSMTSCFLRSKCCQVFASALSSNSQLKKLDLSFNELQDSGVQLLSVGLGSSKCQLETLRLSCCGITEEGCASLASALKSNPFYLRKLDLSYNHPGESGVKLLSERLEDPKCRLEILNVDHNEEHFVNPQLLNKYACDLTFDLDSMNEHLLLSECGRTVSYTKEKQPYPAHPERFDCSSLVLCREGLTGRCYWEVEWTCYVNIAVTYKSLKRKEWDTQIERSDDTWCFSINASDGYSFQHSFQRVFVPIPHVDVKAFLSRPKTLGLFLDWPAGILSFYWLSGNKKTLIYTFHSTFTEPLFPAFFVSGGSLTLTPVAKLKMDVTYSSFTPEVCQERTGISYSFRFPGCGLFRCSLTGLVFNATHEGEVTYRTLIWDDKLLQSAHKMPGGPLFSIECPQDSVSQLHLPHCEPEAALVAESLSVVHITDDGMNILKPLEVTETHVVVDIPHLSGFGVVWDAVKRFLNFKAKPIQGQALLFLRPMHRPILILSVILLPSNVPLTDVKAQHTNSEFIQAPSFCLFHQDQTYSLHSDPEGFTIQPKTAKFFGNYGPNYHATFEIIMPSSTEEVTVMIQDPEKTHVWEYGLHLPAPPSASNPSDSRLRLERNISSDEKLRMIRPRFVDRVSSPVLDKLLDVLQLCRVMTDAEVEEAKAKPRADKARELIDMVRRKGAEASSKLIAAFVENDPFLCSEFGLI